MRNRASCFRGGLTIGLMCFSSMALADLVSYDLVAKSPNDFGMKFSVGFIAGVHHGQAAQATGTVVADLAPLQIQSASLSVPIASMSTGDQTRDCHMLEALGIDYSRSSFPGSHVCDSDLKLPEEGPDAVAFSDIKLELESWAPAVQTGTALQLTPGTSVDVIAVAKVSMHGVTKRGISIPLHIKDIDQGSGKMQVTGTFNLSLKDYGVVVKKFLGLISVSDRVTVALDMVFQPKGKAIE